MDGKRHLKGFYLVISGRHKGRKNTPATENTNPRGSGRVYNFEKASFIRPCFRRLTPPSGSLQYPYPQVLIMQTPCEHKKTIVLARRDGVDYVECLDCRQIFEAEDLESVSAEADEEN
jgi:hypothetical protein